MSGESRAPIDVASPSTLPTLTRRRALMGAAALLAPWTPQSVIADASAPVAAAGPVQLNGNENPYGPSPAARQAILASAGKAPRYADDTITALSERIAVREGVNASQVVIGSGSGELLKISGLLASTSAPGSELVASRPTYEELLEFATKLGLKVKWTTPDSSHRHDLQAMRAAITDQTRLVYVCNPNNPTGAALTSDALAAFIRSVPAHCTVIVDEAYIDFADQPGVATTIGLVKETPNLVVLRTFSKIHGLAGLRVGYAITSPELAERLKALWLTWPNTTGLDAAIASYDDYAFLKSTRAAILADRARVQAAIDARGLRRTESQGNFVFFDTGGPLKQFQDRMLAQGLKVGRHFDGYDTWSRVTIGTRVEVDRFLAALPKALPG